MSTRGSAEGRHIPVLRDRIVELLAPALTEPGAVYVDGTLGMGGHAEAVLDRCPSARLVGVDRDPEALALAGERLARFADRTSFVHAVYDELPEALAELGVDRADAVLFDLGVSSLQLDETDRGFSYSHDAPLDMRMDQSTGPTAAQVLNTYDASDLERVLREYGEERFARTIAAAIVREREEVPFTTSGRLVELLKRVVPAASQKSGGHPGKRTFQALRVEVNAELSVWARALPRALDLLPVGGRVAVLSYHSLEDRITKRVLAQGARSSTPAGLPVELPEHAPYLRAYPRRRSGQSAGASREPPVGLRSAAGGRADAADGRHHPQHRRDDGDQKSIQQSNEGNAPMSQQTATARVASRAAGRRPAPPSQPLRVVPAAIGHPGNGVFAALCMALLIGGLCGLLMLNTAMAEGSFTLNRLQSTSGELTDAHEALTQAIDAQRSPANLASRASRLGMVPADSAAFLRLSDGKVLGVATPATGDRRFTVVTAPSAHSKPGATKAAAAGTTVTKKGDVTSTRVVVTKPDGSVVTTVTSVNATTKTTSSTTTTQMPVTKPAKASTAPAQTPKTRP